MKHTKALFFCIIFFVYSLNGQTQLKEVDKLYQKYKDIDSITVSSAKMTIRFSIETKLNAKGKPTSVTLIGFTGFQDKYDAQSLIDKLESDKRKSGFKDAGTSKLNFLFVKQYQEDITVDVYTKGTQYAKYGIANKVPNSNDDFIYLPNETDEQKKQRQERSAKDLNRMFLGYLVYLEVGDFSRETSNKSQDFKF